MQADFDSFKELMFLVYQCEQEAAQYRALPHRYGDMVLYAAEVHMLRDIDRAGVTTVSEIAEKNGCSKSAASQLNSRLYKKGLIQKLNDDQNRRKVLITLSDTGKQINAIHEKMDVDIYHKHWDVLGSLTQEEIDRFSMFFKQLRAEYARMSKEAQEEAKQNASGVPQDRSRTDP